mgnify:CR=1 FL=1
MIKEKEGCFYMEESGKIVAIINYIETDVITINHTYVDESLRGQGVAFKLLSKVTQYAKNKNKKIHPVCSYAKDKLSGEEYKDLVIF